MEYYTNEVTPVNEYQGDKNVRPFNFTVEASSMTIEDARYTKASLLPMYRGQHLQFGYDISVFVGLSDTAANENDDVMRSELKSLRQSAVAMSVSQKAGANEIVKDWLESSDENNAKKNKLGIWQGSFEEPYIYRKKNK